MFAVWGNLAERDGRWITGLRHKGEVGGQTERGKLSASRRTITRGGATCLIHPLKLRTGSTWVAPTLLGLSLALPVPPLDLGQVAQVSGGTHCTVYRVALKVKA